MTSCHIIPIWHEWNVNANDILMTWLPHMQALVTSCQACMTCVCMHNACALSDFGTTMYFSQPACMQAGWNLGKITASHLGALITQISNKNMPL